MDGVATSRDEFRATAQGVAPGTRVPVERRLTVADPFAAYRRARDQSGGIYLETTGGQAGWGYFGVDPVRRLTVGADAVLLDRERDADGAAASAGPSSDDSPTLAALDGLLDRESLARGDCSVPYPCGALGWLSYDTVRELETLPGDADDDRGLPRLELAVYDALVAWEEPRDGETTLRITACPRVERPGDPGRAYERGLERANALRDRIRDGDPGVGAPPVEADAARFESDAGRAAYAERVRRVKEYVRAGDTFQANVSHRLSAPAAVHPVEAFDALRDVNPAPYSGLVELRGADLVSASPELLLDVDGDRVATEPIAGTRPRSDDRDADRALERELRTDEKERAEHAMLVDLERNDLGKVCAPGSVTVSEYRRVDRYAEVMHLVSLVEGRLREDADVADAVAAAFPGGTITGAPKPRTMAIIDELESTRRGPYTGSIAAFGFDGRATLNIVIRTLVRHGEQYHLRVGAGVVHDSDPEREYEETMDKARALLTAVDEALDAEASLDLATTGGER
jgi:anthranilate synthase component 1